MEEVNRLYLWMGYIGLAVAVFFIIIVALGNFGDNSSMYQNLIARDIAFIESSVLTSNDEVFLEYNYSNIEKEFKIEIREDCEVRVGDLVREYPYAGYYCLNNDFIIKRRSISSSLDSLIFELKNDILDFYGGFDKWLDTK
jgi:hypothetical protein